MPYGVEVIILIILQTAGLPGRVISLLQGLYLNTGPHKHRINTYQTSMHCVGFEPMISASERVQTVRALDR
jgi:xanthine dehydrogenase iron-sulfur cluster and FAD-binding subunit A